MLSPSPIDPEALLAEASFVHRLARALVRREDLAHDVAQEVLVAAMQQRQPPQGLRSWLAAVTRRLAGKMQREPRERARREALVAPPEGDDGGARTAARLQLHRRLTDAVLALPEPYRTVLTMRFFDERSPRAIAQATGRSGDVVRQQLHRGLAMLRSKLDADFGDRSAWATAFVAAGWVASTGLPLLLLSTLAMKNALAAAVCALAVSAWWLWPRDSAVAPPPVPAASTNVAAVATSLPRDSAPTNEPTADERESIAVDSVCAVQVVDDAGAPIADARVQCWSQQGTVIEHRSDHDGRSSFGAVNGAGGFVVRAVGRQPAITVLAECRGSHRVVMSTGNTVAGVLMIDGAAAREGWRLDLCGKIDVDAAVPEVLAKELRGDVSSETMTQPNGTFAFVGLPTGWRGSIKLPQPLWLLPESGGSEDNHQRLPVDNPRSDLAVLTTQLQTIKVKVLWDDTGEAVPNPRVSAYGEFANGESGGFGGRQGDEHGRIAIGFSSSYGGRYLFWCEPKNRPRLRQVRVLVDANGSHGTTTTTLQGEQLATPTEVVIRLPRAGITHFVTVDRHGAAIAGARVSTQDISDPTDSAGRGMFYGAPKDVKLVGAKGFRIGPCQPRAAAEGTAGDPLVFELEPTNTLRVRLRAADGSVPQVDHVVLRSTKNLFAGNRYSGTLDSMLEGTESNGTGTGKNQPDGSTLWTEFKCFLQPDAKGCCELRSLEPSLSCVAAAVDNLDRDIVAVPLTTPALGDTLDVELVVPGAARRVAGHVLDTHGNAIAGADCELRMPDGDSRVYRNTAADGGFRFDVIHGDDALRLTIKAEGFVAQQHDDIHSTDDDSDRTFRLEQGNIVTVQVVDGAGAPVAASPLLLEDSDLHDDRDMLADNASRFRNLPSGNVTFKCTIGGKRFTLTHDTRDPNATLRVPTPATITLTAPAGWPAPSNRLCAIYAVVDRLDETTPTFDIWSPATNASHLLLPGRYRMRLVERNNRDPNPELSQRELGLHADVTLAAGQQLTVELR